MVPGRAVFQRSPDLLTDLNTEAWHVLFFSYSWDRELAGRRLGQVGAKPVTMCPSNASMTFVCVRVCARVCLQVGIFFSLFFLLFSASALWARFPCYDWSLVFGQHHSPLFLGTESMCCYSRTYLKQCVVGTARRVDATHLHTPHTHALTLITLITRDFSCGAVTGRKWPLAP